MIPVKGTLERVFLDRVIELDRGVTYLDFVGTGITEENIDQVVENLRTGMYQSEYDDYLELDS